MRKRMNWKKLSVTAATLLIIITASGSSRGQTTPTPTPSAASSPTSDTRANDDALRRACAEAVEELKAARRLIDARQIEVQRYEDLLKLEQEIKAKMRDIANLSEAEKAELRKAIDAKDRQVAALEAAIVVLKANRWSTWKWIKAAAVGAGAGIVIGSVLKR